MRSVRKTADGSAHRTTACALATLLMGAWACVRPPVEVPGFFRYGRREANALLERNNIRQGWVSQVGRNSSGSMLYLYGYSDSATILDVNGKRTVVPGMPSSVAYLNDEGQWAAWLTPGTAHFVGGWTRPAHRLWTDPGVRHYLLQTKDGALELGTTDGRLKQSVAGFEPLRIFADSGKVYMFGVWPEASETRCQVLRETPSGYEPQDTVRVAPFGQPVSVIDMDLAAERVVVARSLDLNPYWLLFDFKTRTLENIGRTSDFGVFLKGDALTRAAATQTDALGASEKRVETTR